MSSKFLKYFFRSLWQLSAALLIAAFADAHSVQTFSKELSTQVAVQHPCSHLSYVAGQEENTPSSDLPQELPTGETEADEENKEEDGSEDDWSDHSTHSQALSASFIESISSYYQSASNRLDVVPFYVLFHCWKNFLV